MYNLHGKDGPVGGVPAVSTMVKSISFEEKNRDQLLMVVIAYLYSVELLCIYHR